MSTLLSPSSKLAISQKKKCNLKVLNNCISLKSKVKINKSKFIGKEQISILLTKTQATLSHSKSPKLLRLQLPHPRGLKPHLDNSHSTSKDLIQLPISSSSKSTISSNRLLSQQKVTMTISQSPYRLRPLDSSRNRKKDSRANNPSHKKTNSMVSHQDTSRIVIHNTTLRLENRRTDNSTRSTSSAKKDFSPFNTIRKKTIKVNQINIKQQRKPKGINQSSITRNTNPQYNAKALMNSSNFKSNISHLINNGNSDTFNRIKKSSLVTTRINKPHLKNSIYISCSEKDFNLTNTLSTRHSSSVNKIKLNAKTKLTRHIPSINTFSTSANASTNDLLHNNPQPKRSSRNSRASYRSNNSQTNMETLNKSLGNTAKSIHSISKMSQTGFAGSNKSKVNQDNLFVFSPNDNEYLFVGVCDGHGNKGEQISKFLIEILPLVLHKELKEKDILISSSSNALIHKALDNSFILTNSKLSNDSTIDTDFSGSTCVCVLLSNDKLYCANVGDSRALLGKCHRERSTWDFIPLSRDHKPTEMDEAKRISRFGGRIEQYKEEDGTSVGPKRIWLKSKDIPGLAMTRSFGDQIASNVGVTCEPEIKDVILKEEDKFIVLASDGLWEYISNEECVEIISHYYRNGKDSESAIKELYKRAFRKWIENDTLIDDITIILIFFN